MKALHPLVLLVLVPLSVAAQDWSVSVASGPFVFGDFAESTLRIGAFQNQPGPVTHSLTADTRAGAVGALERFFNDRLSARLEVSYTEAPLAIRSGDDDEAVDLDVAEMSVTTAALPVVFRFNRGGRLRPLVYAGPAWVIYEIDPSVVTGTVPLFSGSREKVGGIAGGGVEWWWRDSFGLRLTISDIVTESPLERTDFPGPAPSSLELRTPHNIHTAAGVSYRF